MDRRREIFINGRYLTQQMTGVQRYATEVVSSLDKFLEAGILGKELRVTLLAPQGDFHLPALKSIRVVQGGVFSGHLWEQIDLPRLAKGGVLFNPCGPSPLFHSHQVTTLHDASIFLAPQGYSFPYRTWTRLLYLWSGFHARVILTVSNYSRKQLLKSCRTISPEKIQVVYPGSDHILRYETDPAILEDLFEETRRDYVLCVGSQQANKNLKIMEPISRWLDKKGISTVITGGKSKAVFRGGTMEDGVILKTGYVNDAQLRSLYQNALCFIFPSLEEGFGIPPLEAMRCGCPVLSSSSASMPEVCGDGAIYFDPRNEESLEKVLGALLSDPLLAAKLKAKGMLQAQKYNWDQTALGVWNYLHNNN